MLLIAASILAARKLAQYEGAVNVSATICAISDTDPTRRADHHRDRPAMAGDKDYPA
jgi:hypothetical protein